MPFDGAHSQPEQLIMKQVLLDLMRHMDWADSLVADALERALVSDARALGLFAHIASVEHLWYTRIQRTPAAFAVWPDMPLAVSRVVAGEHAALLQRLVGQSDGEALLRVVEYRNSAGRDYCNSVGEIVTHIAMHGSHHRGQIAQLLRASGQEPPYVDYIQFMRREQER
jgi:uncharacterized damage-inducible protein DinB